MWREVLCGQTAWPRPRLRSSFGGFFDWFFLASGKPTFGKPPAFNMPAFIVQAGSTPRFRVSGQLPGPSAGDLAQSPAGHPPQRLRAPCEKPLHLYNPASVTETRLMGHVLSLLSLNSRSTRKDRSTNRSEVQNIRYA